MGTLPLPGTGNGPKGGLPRLQSVKYPSFPKAFIDVEFFLPNDSGFLLRCLCPLPPVLNYSFYEPGPGIGLGDGGRRPSSCGPPGKASAWLQPGPGR